MEFIETPTFTSLVLEMMDDDDYMLLQLALVMRPDFGKLIPGGGGIRKMRWASYGRGKSGGFRIIYYWQPMVNRIWMLLLYRKSEHGDLTRDQIKQLKNMVKAFES